MDDEVPLKIHKRYYGKCRYISLIENYNNTLNFKSDPQNKSIIESKLCKICLVNDYNVMFSPCAHIVACSDCANMLTKCPICQQAFNNIIKIYFS
jgi:hypothetical protein